MRAPIFTSGRAVRIVVVGGPSRLTPAFHAVAKLYGHRIEHHDGCAAGRGLQVLDAMIGRADLVVIVTRINSHAAVLHARDLARRHAKPSLIRRTFGVARLTQLCEALSRRDFVWQSLAQPGG